MVIICDRTNRDHDVIMSNPKTHDAPQPGRAPLVQLPSDRSTGFVFAGAALAVAWFWRDNLTVLTLALGTAEIFTVLALSFPLFLRPLNVAWFRFGQALHKVMNPVVMLALFAVAIVPAGLIMQRFRDPLRLKRPMGASYWVKAGQDGLPPSSMTQQF